MNNKKPNEQHWKLLVQLLKEIADEKGITQLEIAEKTGKHQPLISRFFSSKHCPSLSLVAEIAATLGKELVLKNIDNQNSNVKSQNKLK